ncbi:unnamed protein product [Caenorhabditis sp. 36 PRJEB53466]|nr:unnamed protein product [Caenorhabditis sp. 36 PRJEB53466]
MNSSATCSNGWLQVTFFAEAVGFAASFILNTVLLILISRTPRATFGNYKFLMFAFSASGIVYSSTNFWSKPNVHITKTSFIVFTVLKYSKFSKSFGSIAVTGYCSCYAMMLSLLVIHFYYRLTSVTAPMRLTKFSRENGKYWALLVLSYAFIWGFCSYFLCGPTEQKDLELMVEFQNSYCLFPQEYAYVGPQYYYEIGNEGIVPNFPSIIGMSVLASLMGGTFIFVTYFGTRTYKALTELGVTCYGARELQKQLFRTLVIQTLIPFVFILDAMANLIPISVAIYPCLEPLVAMFFIKNFRDRIKDFLTCYRKHRISDVPTSQTENVISLQSFT